MTTRSTTDWRGLMNCTSHHYTQITAMCVSWQHSM